MAPAMPRWPMRRTLAAVPLVATALAAGAVVGEVLPL
jgi:hypothetical protein